MRDLSGNVVVVVLQPLTNPVHNRFLRKCLRQRLAAMEMGNLLE